MVSTCFEEDSKEALSSYMSQSLRLTSSPEGAARVTTLFKFELLYIRLIIRFFVYI
jgi:hypothetical protein